MPRINRPNECVKCRSPRGVQISDALVALDVQHSLLEYSFIRSRIQRPNGERAIELTPAAGPVGLGSPQRPNGERTIEMTPTAGHSDSSPKCARMMRSLMYS